LFSLFTILTDRLKTSRRQEPHAGYCNVGDFPKPRHTASPPLDLINTTYHWLAVNSCSYPAQCVATYLLLNIARVSLWNSHAHGRRQHSILTTLVPIVTSFPKADGTKDKAAHKLWSVALIDSSLSLLTFFVSQCCLFQMLQPVTDSA